MSDSRPQKHPARPLDLDNLVGSLKNTVLFPAAFLKGVGDTHIFFAHDDTCARATLEKPATRTSQGFREKRTSVTARVRSAVTQSIIVPIQTFALDSSSRGDHSRARRRSALHRSSALPASSDEWRHNLSFRGVIVDGTTTVGEDDPNESVWCRIHKQSLMELSMLLFTNGMEWVGGILVLLLWSLPGRVLARAWDPIRRYLARFVRSIVSLVPLPDNGNLHISRFFGWMQAEKHRLATGRGHNKYVYAGGAALWARRTMLRSGVTKERRRWKREH